MSEARKQTVLVTGSSGCLGQHVVKLLHELDDTVGEVRCFDVKPFQNNLQHKIIKEMQITTADIRNERQLINAMKDVDVIIHCAALVDLNFYPNKAEMQSVNVDGTQRIIDAAIECNVPYLVHLSGADVAIGPDPIYYGSENTTFVPKKHLLGDYSKSKHEAEQIVTEANGRTLANGTKKLQTIILRPSMIYGEEDAHFVTKILTIAKCNSGVLRRIDNVFIRIQPVYAGNVAVACIRAKDKLQVDPSVGGEHFFITDDTKILDPFDFVEPYVKAKGFQLSKRAYPYWLFILVLALYSWLINLLWSVYPIKLPSYLTTPNVRYICNTYFFNRTKATLRLDYEPQYEHEESESRSVQFYKKVPL